jgi:hypothetical protein
MMPIKRIGETKCSPCPSQNPIPSYPHQGRSNLYLEIASQEGEPGTKNKQTSEVKKGQKKGAKDNKAEQLPQNNCRFQSLPNKFRKTNSTTHTWTRKHIPTMRSMQNFSCRAPSDASSLEKKSFT